MQTKRFSREELTAAVRTALEAASVPAHVAAVEADVMVEADLHGVPSHGVIMLPRLLAALGDGRVAADPPIRVAREQGAVCVFDGGRGPGRYVAATAMDRALDRARPHGIGLCLASNTTHWGRAHAYACRAARAGLVGLCTTNAIPTLAVPGVARAVLGNNPIAIGVPRRPDADPIVLDLAMTQAALGKVATHRRDGRPVPAGWGLDAAGEPTTDPLAILASGLLLPMGGHKGIGLAVVVELLTAALAGAPFGHEIAQLDASGLDPGTSKLFVAIDVAALADRAAFDARVDAMVDYLKAVDPEHPLLAPGERGWRASREHERDGIPVHPEIVAQLKAAGVVLPE
jgi:LDH2 family malate/lactate/ureidoglycolate dehydrogenase